MSAPPSKTLVKARFGVFEFDLRTGELWKHGLRIRLQEQPARVLGLLLSRSGELVSRDEIRRELWTRDVFVDFEHGLHRSINKLRDALSDSAAEPRFIETRARAGYRFVAPVDFVSDAPPQVPVIADIKAEPPPSAESAQVVLSAAVIVPMTDSQSKDRSLPGGAVLKQIALSAAMACLVLLGFALHRFFSSASLLPGLQLTRQGAAGFWLTKPPLTPPEARLRQLTINSSENPVRTGAISPDGRYLAYADLKGIHLQNVQTGEMETIAQPEALKHGLVDWKIACWLPDSTKFLANLKLPSIYRQEAAQHPSIWIGSVLGGALRKLRGDAEAWSVSPDGSRIAFAANYGDHGPREIRLMDKNGDEEGKVFDTDETTSIGGAQFSPDGQQLAYIKSPEMFSSSTGPGNLRKAENVIEIRNLKSGPPSTIFSSTTLRDFLWLRDGRIIYALADRTEPKNISGKANADSCNYWTMRVDPRTGKWDKNPTRITNWGGFCLEATSVTADGKQLAFLQWNGQSNTYVAELLANGRRIGAPTRLTLSDSRDTPLAWTSDSKQIFFLSTRNGHVGIFKQALYAGTAEPVVTGTQDAVNFYLSPDGTWVLYVLVPDVRAATPVSLRRVATTGGPSQLVYQAATHDQESSLLDGDYRCANYPATLCAVSDLTADHKQLIFIAFDPTNGRGRELGRFDVDARADYDWALSPDGSRIVIRKNGEARLTMLSLSNHRSHQITIMGWSAFINLNWAADAKGLFTSALLPRSSVLLYVDLNGNAQPLWEQQGSLFTWAVPSPDGRQVILSSWTEKANIWLLENF